MISHAVAEALSFALSAASTFLAHWAGTAALWIVLIGSIGQMIDIWRSVRRGEPASGVLFAHASRLVTVGYLLVVAIVSAAALISRQIAVPPVVATIEPHYLRVVPQEPTQLIFSGGIGEGAAGDMRHWLEIHPGTRIVVLDSRGGLPDEARNLGDVIGERGIATYVTRNCAAECVTTFLAGNPRWIAPGARIGMRHEMTDPGGDAERWRLVNAGATTGFADEAASKPAGILWYPTDDELLSGNVIAAVTFDPIRELPPTLRAEQP